jgi:hypothetical protein
MNIQLRPATNRNTKAYWISAFGVHILFSYNTPVAYEWKNKRARRNNDWGPTTGRHMNECDVKDYPVIDDEEQFEAAIDAAVIDALRSGVVAKLIGDDVLEFEPA